MARVTEAYDWRGRNLIDRDGEKIGTVDEIYVDADGGHPEWARVTTGLLGNHSSFVPLASAMPRREDVVVQVTKEQVKDSPRVEPADELSQEQEIALYRHYGIDFDELGSVSAAEDRPPGARTGHAIGERSVSSVADTDPTAQRPGDRHG